MILNNSRRRSVRSARLAHAALEALEARRLFASTAGFTGSYSQSFDSLINSGTPPTPSGNGPIDLSDSSYTAAGFSGTETRDGWAFLKTSGSGSNAVFKIDDGTLATGAVYSYGTVGSSDRALGSLASGTTISALGLTLVNNTSSTINSFVVTYDGEQWHRGNNAANVLTFNYEIGGTFSAPALTGYTGLPALNFTAPVTTGTNVAVDGNNAGKVAGITATISGVNWAPGQTLVLRWDDANDTGNDDGIAIDNVNVSLPSVVNPGSLAFANSTETFDESAGNVNIPVVRSNGTGGAVSVTYTITGGTATNGSDYTALATGTLNFANGVSSQNIPISIIDDTLVEPNETIQIALSNPTNSATLGTQTTNTVVIHDNDGVAPTGLLLNEINVNPPGTDNPFEYWELKGNSNQMLNDVYLVSVEGDAASNPGNATYVFNAGNFALGSNGLALVTAPDSGFSPDAGTAVIQDPVLDTGGGILQNGANSFLVIYSKNTPITLNTDLDPTNSGSLTLPAGAQLLDGVGWTTGTAGDIAYGAVVPTLLISNGTTPSAATRDPNNSTALSPSAWFAGVTLGGNTYDVARSTLNTPSNETLTPGAPNQSGTNSNGVFAFGPTTYTVSEGAGSISIPVYRFGGSAGAVTVDYNTNDGTATAGSDYTMESNTLNFADGQTMMNIVIPIINDTVPELPENFTVSLSNATNGSNLNTNRTTATVTINDDDVTAPSGVLLNEISVNPPGTDNPFEFVELEGPVSSTLNEVYFVSVEGDPGTANPGNVSAVFNMTGISFGSNGLILIEGATPGFPGVDGATTIDTQASFDTASVLQNGSNSFLVVFSPTAITSGMDLDPTNSGTLALPSGASVLDGVGWSDPGTPGGIVYGTQLSLTTPATDPPTAASRILGNTTANSASSWYYGKIQGTVDSGLTYDPAQSSANLPSGAMLTPGAANFAVTDTTPPTVVGSFNVDSHPQSITLTFSEPVDPSFTLDDVTLTETNSPSSTVPTANMILTEGSNNTFTITFQNYPHNALPDGRYHLVIPAGSVTDTSNNALAADFTLDFAVLGADATGDGKVNALDFNALATNFGHAGTFSQGDFNYDGSVGTSDFMILVSQFGKVLPASAPALGSVANLFSTTALTDGSARDDILD